MGRITDRRGVLRIRADQRPVQRPDNLVVEEPLEIRVDGTPLAVTMRTPGHDIELALGFLVSEGVIRETSEVKEARYCSDVVETAEENVVDVTLTDGHAGHVHVMSRNVTMTSACGLCGRTSIDSVRTASAYDLTTDQVEVTPSLLSSLPDAMRDRQRAFDRTGGLHAVGVFDADAHLVVLREDVGRHNAFDKVVGWALQQERLPLAGHIALVSGRASFELVQKAALAGIPVLAAVSAPSTLAVDLADELGITLVGFLRGPSMNVYAHPHRITGL